MRGHKHQKLTGEFLNSVKCSVVPLQVMYVHLGFLTLARHNFQTCIQQQSEEYKGKSQHCVYIGTKGVVQ